jgi:predicted DNA-binding protein (UPF0251 family)
LVVKLWAVLKKNRICHTTVCQSGFKPTGTPLPGLTQVYFLAEELEAIRLCDLTGLTQEQAGQEMGISRGTVQRILTGARKKIASALVNGEALIFK